MFHWRYYETFLCELPMADLSTPIGVGWICVECVCKPVEIESREASSTNG